MERDTLVLENAPIEEASNVQETQQPLPEVNNSSHLEDDRLIARARAVGVDYEFAKPGEVETEDDRRKRQRRNQRRISEQEKRLVKLLEIHHLLHLQGQVSKKTMHTVLFVHLRWSR